MNTIRLYIILGIIGLGGLMILAGAKALELALDQPRVLRVTQDTRFVVSEIQRDSTWTYTLRSQKRDLNKSEIGLRSSNLQSDEKITTLIVETDKPMGYAKGDTLALINNNRKKLNAKLR